MRALLCETFGEPELLSLREVPLPQPAAGEVRIRVRAAGVNFPDALIIQNRYQIKPTLPFSPGSEVAGEVDALGEGVTQFDIGDRVAAMTIFGGFAEYVVVKQSRVLSIPDAMPFDVAAGFTMAYGTSYHALKQRAALQAGETVLVLGAAGGVGLTAVELAVAMGARVIAAASSEDKLALTHEYGATHTLNSTDPQFRQHLNALTEGRGVDVIYDPVGGALTEQAFRSIAWRGRHLVIGFAAGDIPALPLNLPLLKGAAIVGVVWGQFTMQEPQVHRDNAQELYALYLQGKLKPHISRHFTLDRGAEAIRWLMDRKVLGKIVVTI